MVPDSRLYNFVQNKLAVGVQADCIPRKRAERSDALYKSNKFIPHETPIARPNWVFQLLFLDKPNR